MFSLDSLLSAFSTNVVRSTTTPTPARPPAPSDPTPINLMRGWPSPSLLPADLIRKAAHAALSDPAISTPGLLYGPDPGYEPCREAIAAWLTDFYRRGAGQDPVTASRICITGGASQNLGAMLNVYTDPAYTRAIWIVAPAYMLAFRIFEDAGFGGKMRGVREDDQGVDLASLRRGLEDCEREAQKRARNGLADDRPRYKPDRKRAKVYKHVLYCVPTFSNPSSRTMSLQHRTELVRIAREYDILLVADDVYDFLQWPADSSITSLRDPAAMQKAHLPRLVDIDRDLPGSAPDGFGNAIANGSFSKIVGPGVRVGWVEATEKFTYGISQAGTTASGGAPSQLTSTYITTLLTSSDLTKHINEVLRPGYAVRYRVLLAAVTKDLLPLGFALPQTDREVFGGYFVWLALPRGLSAKALAKQCMSEDGTGVIVAPGGIFEVPAHIMSDGAESNNAIRFDGFIRLCFAWEEESRLAEGVRRIGAVARGMVEEQEAGAAGFVTDEESDDHTVEAFK
ncbi:Valine--pyruvate aminotransferase [Teratosphaeriaceae sp. CCFEE 6253]|nr:Valine--pyruvate aminotransferase [Teratosphaeriaceae sp. CCFEE 6253]